MRVASALCMAGVVSSLSLIAGAPASQPPACTIADQEFWAPRSIDGGGTCGEEGSGEAAHQAQNRAKNNLCAGGFLTSNPTDTPARVTQYSFRKLEVLGRNLREELGLGIRTTPPDRTPFQQTVYTTVPYDRELAEGTLIQYVGFLLEGHFTGEEGVNCDLKTQVNHDIHMAFVEQKPPPSPTDAQAETLECSSITAEIIPRRRPEAWDFLGRMKKTKRPRALKGALTKIAAHDLDRPMRLTGQLFFDGSHEACRNGKRVGGQPARASNWEIHPVYAIEVCKNRSITGCRWDREDVWVPLHEWLDGADDQ